LRRILKDARELPKSGNVRNGDVLAGFPRVEVYSSFNYYLTTVLVH
jgi:hypothetical protein